MRSYQADSSPSLSAASDSTDLDGRPNRAVSVFSNTSRSLLGSWGRRCVGAALLVTVLWIGSSSVVRQTKQETLGSSGIASGALDVEGKSNKSKSSKSNKKSDKSAATTPCEDGKYSKRTLQYAFELPFAALFKDNKGQNRYEASSIILKDDSFYAVCDNSWAVSKFSTSLDPFSSANVQIGTPNPEGVEDSGFEAIFWDDDSFYVVRESVQHADSHFHAVVEQVRLGENNYTVVEACSSDFKFEGTSKGFEGAVSIRDTNNEMVILGLCEGNHCSETRKFDRGNGRIVAMKRIIEEDGTTCTWSAVRTINVPSNAYFHDYSDIAVDAKGRVAITTQEDSQVWIGQMLGLDPETGRYDLNAMELDPDVYSVFDFPKNNECETIYCNIEGVEWLNDQTIVVVSDKMKGKGKQDFLCFDKDQSVHVFVLPD
jgi:hypothetical protein